MAIAGGDIGPARLQHQAGQAQAATQFDNAPAFNVDALNGSGERLAGGPELTKQAPTGGTNTHLLGFAVGVGILPSIAQGTNFPLSRAYIYAEFARGIPWHSNTSNKIGPAASSVDVRWV